MREILIEKSSKNSDKIVFLTLKSRTHIKGLPSTIQVHQNNKDYPIDSLEVFVPEYTPEKITELKENEIFVFGSNTEGRHGAGAAKFAVEKFGAIYGKAEGLQGQSYAIITTDLSLKEIFKNQEKYPLNAIYENILRFIEFARRNPNLKFYVTKIGSFLAGYSIEEIATQFKRCSNFIQIPLNVILPREYEHRF